MMKNPLYSDGRISWQAAVFIVLSISPLPGRAEDAIPVCVCRPSAVLFEGGEEALVVTHTWLGRKELVGPLGGLGAPGRCSGGFHPHAHLPANLRP